MLQLRALPVLWTLLTFVALRLSMFTLLACLLMRVFLRCLLPSLFFLVVSSLCVCGTLIFYFVFRP